MTAFKVGGRRVDPAVVEQSMPFRSKYDGTCTICLGGYTVGEQIRFLQVPGVYSPGYVHADCPTRPRHPEQQRLLP